MPTIEHPSYDEWLRAYADVYDALPEHLERACPMCAHRQLRLEFIARESDRIGSVLFWCDNCLFGVHLSRARVPVGVDFHRRGTPWEELSKYIPEYTTIYPPVGVTDSEGLDEDTS